MSTYASQGYSPVASRFVQGIDMPDQVASYISSRRGGVMSVSYTAATHQLARDYARTDHVNNMMVQYCGTLLITPTSNLTVAPVQSAVALPALPAGFNGQELTIFNVDATFTLTLQDRGTSATSGMFLSTSTFVLSQWDNITLEYLTVAAAWIERSRTNVL